MEMQFKDNLKLLRKNVGLNQKKLAEGLGVALSTVAMWETGSRQPNYKMLNKIADFFGVSYDRLLSGPSDSDSEMYDTADEISALRDMLRTRPEMKMLFSVSKNASKADIERAVAIIEALKSNN